MNYARVEKSRRLQSILIALHTGPKTTRELIALTGQCAINSTVAELRENGYDIRCNLRERTKDGSMIYVYALVSCPPARQAVHLTTQPVESPLINNPA